MKIGPLTKLDKKNKSTLQKFDDNFMSENCNVIILIYGQFEAI